MIDFKIKKGLSTDLYVEPGVVNPRLIIEAGCWYLCTDTAELFLGVYAKDENGQDFLTLKQINGTHESGSAEVDLTGYAKLTDIPDVSEFITNAEVVALIPEVPTKVGDLVNDAGYITAEDVPETDLSGYYNKEEVDGLISGIEHPTVDLTGYATKEDVAKAVGGIEIPDVSGFIKEIPAEYITEEELSAKGYLTEHQSLEGYAKLSDVPSVEGLATEKYVTDAIAGIKLPEVPDVSDFITIEEVEAKGYLTAVPSEYITETELVAKGYLTEHQDLSHLATKEELPSLEGYAKTSELFSGSYNDLTNKPEIPSIAGLATEEFVNQKIAEAELAGKEVDLGAYYTKSEVDGLIPDVSGFIKEIPSEYITESELATELAKLEIPEEYNDSEIRELINSKAASDHSHDEYALTEHTHDEYLTEHQSLAEYAKKSELFSKDYNDLTNKPTIPSLEGYATEAFVDENYYDKAEVGPFITKVEALETFKTDVTTNYATKQYVIDAIDTHEGIAKKAEVEEVKAKLDTEILPIVPTVQELVETAATQEWVNEQGFLTEHQSLEEYAKKIDIPEAEIYKVDFNAPDYAKAVEAYNNGKVLVLINAAPDINSYAIMNYVRDDIISFTKFLMSRSGTYGSFNTYYLHNDGTWELAKEVKLNKVEITNDGDLQVGKQTLEIPSVDGFATEEYVDNKIGEIRLPEAELFVVDFNTPDFAAAVEAYNNGKFLVLANAVPDANGYAVMNYVRADLITFTKFLTSRSEAYGSFNTYYLHIDNTWEISKEVRLNKVEANPSEEATGELNKVRIGKEVYSLPSIAGLATEDFVQQELAKIEHPTVDLSGLVTLESFNSALAEKADKVPFTTDKFVTRSVGGFVEGESIKGLTIAELFAKLLGLSDDKPGENPEEPDAPGEGATPEEIADYLIATETPIYSQDDQGVLVASDFANTTWTEEEAAVQMNGVSTFYQIVDDTGSVIESGYQEATTYNNTDWLTVALPNTVTSFSIKKYDGLSNGWFPVNFEMEKAVNQTIEGYTIWTVPEKYEIMAGSTYRFVIE